jgi:hypothetical protein
MSFKAEGSGTLAKGLLGGVILKLEYRPLFRLVGLNVDVDLCWPGTRLG